MILFWCKKSSLITLVTPLRMVQNGDAKRRVIRGFVLEPSKGQEGNIKGRPQADEFYGSRVGTTL